MFSDFQCAFCLKSLPTIETLLAKYGADLRIVYKHHPLVFHKRAEPAAQLAIVAFREQGDAGFWKAHDALFAQHEQLGSSELAVLAGTLGLDPEATMKAVATHEHQSIIDKDQLLALDLEVFGTPQFFVNGRRVVGARSQEEFEELIDEELAKARALVERGTPREQVYATIMKDALPGFPPPRISIAGPSPTHPSRGPKNAPVVIQVFGDLEDELSAHVVPTLARLMEAFPKDVRVVFRHRPSPLHPASPMAAQATIEALAQNGNAGFWKLHDRLFEHYRDDLTREALDGHARAVGLDVPRLRKALDDGTHVAAMQADVDVAETAGIRSPPGFVINGYLMKGKQTLDRFKRVVLLALDDAAQGRTSP